LIDNINGISVILLEGTDGSAYPIVSIGEDNLITQGTNGIRVYAYSSRFGSPTVSINGSTISNNLEGLYVGSSINTENINVYSNSLINNSEYSVSNFGTGTLNATHNWWGSAVLSTINSTISGNVSFLPYYVDAEMTTLSTTPAANGSATVTNSTPQVVITNSTQNVTVTIENGTANASIDVSTLVSNATVNGTEVITGTIPQITIDSSVANVVIPTTNISCANSSWDGVIDAPTVTTVVVPNTATETMTTSTAIEIGFADAKLSFDNAVRILFPDQKDKRVGYSRTGTAFTEITAVCSADNQTIGDALGVDGDCKINVGDDLVVWTKHFTSFATFSSTAVIDS
jgi:hypothetical protein